MRSPSLHRRVAVALVAAVTASLLSVFALAAPASAAPPTYVVGGDVGGGNQWFLNGTYFSELRSVIQNSANFGPNGTVRATYSLAAPRSVPLTPNALNGLDVYVVSARDLVAADVTEIQRFRNAGGAIVVSSNAPAFFDDTAWLGIALSPRVVFGDGPAPYADTHRANSPSRVAADQTNHPLMNGPFGTVSTFDNWHSVAGFTSVPASGSVLARTTLTAPADGSGTASNVTITNVATLAAFPRGAFGAGSGPVVATSDVDTYSNAYTVAPALASDAANTLTGTGNGVLARNTFAWIADQLMALDGLSSYVPLTAPVRALDTRDGSGAFGPGTTRTISLTGVPSDATMVAVNLTAVDPTSNGYLTAWPAGSGVPNVSNVNFVAGTTVANAAFVRLGVNGQISLYNSSGSTHVLVDVVGYGGSGASRLVNIAPTRIKDTRTGLGGFGVAGPASTQSLQVTGGVVPGNATAVVLNVTADVPTESGYVTVYPGGPGARPGVSNLNMRAGVTVPNLVVVRLNDGKINLFNFAGSTHLVVDVFGYFVPGSSGSVTGATPTRMLDTRAANAPLAAGEARTVATGLTGGTAIIMNVTAVDPAAAGFLTVYAANEGRPNSSNLNFRAGQTVPNLVVVRTAPDGTIKVFNSAGSTHLIVDVVGRFDG